MIGIKVDISATSPSDAAKANAESRHGYKWPVGLYVIIDAERTILESRAEADALVAEICKAADYLWPTSAKLDEE